MEMAEFKVFILHFVNCIGECDVKIGSLLSVKPNKLISQVQGVLLYREFLCLPKIGRFIGIY